MQKKQSPACFGRKSCISQPLMGLSCVRDFSELPHSAPLPHRRDEGFGISSLAEVSAIQMGQQFATRPLSIRSLLMASNALPANLDSLLAMADGLNDSDRER